MSNKIVNDASPAEYRVEVLRWSIDPTPRPYWTDSGCGRLTLERARDVFRAGRDAHELVRIVETGADKPREEASLPARIRL